MADGIRERRPASILLNLVVLAFAWWATGLRPFTGVAYAVVVGSGVVAMAWGALRLRPRPPGPDWPAGTLRRWVVLTGALAAWQLAAFVQHPRFDHPTLSSLANRVLEPQPVRALALAGWLVVAARLARRSAPTTTAQGR
ncbi:MAG: hypothetical protein ACRDZ3_02190 [Acidimicrobiia bacterium]